MSKNYIEYCESCKKPTTWVVRETHGERAMSDVEVTAIGILLVIMTSGAWLIVWLIWRHVIGADFPFATDVTKTEHVCLECLKE